MKKKPNKLKIHRETLRNLSREELDSLAGGDLTGLVCTGRCDFTQPFVCDTIGCNDTRVGCF